MFPMDLPADQRQKRLWGHNWEKEQSKLGELQQQRDLVMILTPQFWCPKPPPLLKHILSLPHPLPPHQPAGPSRMRCQRGSANPSSGNLPEGWLFSHRQPEMKGTFCAFLPTQSRLASPAWLPAVCLSSRACAASSEGMRVPGLLQRTIFSSS